MTIKKVTSYGVEMTGYESTKLDEWILNSNIAMNTLTEDERKLIIKDFLAQNRMKEKIKKLLRENSYNWIADDGIYFRYFRRSEYYKYLKEDIEKYKGDGNEIAECTKDYAEKFGRDVRYLNLNNKQNETYK